MSKMMHDQPSAAVPASRDRRNFLIAGAGLALAATTLGRSGVVMAKPAGQDTPNAPSDAAPVRKETLTTRKLGSPRSGSFPLSLRRIHSVLPAWRYTKMDGSLSPRWAICSEVLFGLSNPTAPVSR